jgi:hypothetical protein
MSGIMQTLLGGLVDTFPFNGFALGASHGVIDPADAGSELRLTNGGDILQFGDLGGADGGDWISPKINMALYEVRVTAISGTLDLGVLNTWKALSSSRGYGIIQTTPGLKTFSGTLEIRRASDGAIVSTSTLDLSANVEI